MPIKSGKYILCVGHAEPVEVCGQGIAHPSTGSG